MKASLGDESLYSTFTSILHVKESDAMNIAVCDNKTVTITKSKGAKVHYHKYQRGLYKVWVCLDWQGRNTRPLYLVCGTTLLNQSVSQKADESFRKRNWCSHENVSRMSTLFFKCVAAVKR
jgi:hypothetical protein